MAEEQGRRPFARVDHATLLVAANKQRSAPSAHRDACRKILAQVYRVVAAVLGPRSADVADVSQDAFMRVYKNLHGFSYDPQKPAGPTAWINKIALRVALDHRAGLPPWEGMEASLSESPDEDAGDVGVALDRAVLAAALLERLDERHRAILILHYWNGETQEEIAATLSVPIGTVKTRMRAAHQRIREYVKEHARDMEEDPIGGEEGLVEA
jgi:RNA polymerase sigma factor (sigma-70 family)